MNKEDRFPIKTYWIYCCDEKHEVKLMSDGRLDFSHHWNSLGVDVRDRREFEARWALSEIARQGNPESDESNDPGCFGFLQYWRSQNFGGSSRFKLPSIPYEKSIESMKRIRRNIQEDQDGMQKILNDKHNSTKWRTESLRANARRYIRQIVENQMNLRAHHLDSSEQAHARFSLHIPQLGEELYQSPNPEMGDSKLGSYCFNFHDWYKTVYLPLGNQIVVTPNLLMTVKASPVSKRVYALLQTNIYEPFEAKFRVQSPGFSKEDPSILYALIVDKQLIATGSHPRELRTGKRW